MSDKIKGFIVSLNNDIHKDNINNIIMAIQMICGVAGVTTIPTKSDGWIARKRVKEELRNKISDWFESL